MGIAGNAVAAIPAFRNDRRLQRDEKGDEFIARSLINEGKDTPNAILSP
jgi:hypothetical protein